MGTQDRNLKLRRHGRKPSTNIIKNKYNLQMLDLFASYALSNNKNVTRQGLMHMRQFMDLLDISLYITNDEEMERIELTKRALEARLDHNLTNRDLIICYINGGLFIENPINVIPIEISNDEVEYVDTLISDVLKYLSVLDKADDMIEIATKFKSGKINSNLIGQFEQLINNSNTDLKKLEPDRPDYNKFSMQDNVFINAVTNMYLKVTSNSNKLKTGMVGLNALLKGGFEKSRVYLLVGATGGGKSLTLLNIAYQIKKYNRNIELKDPTKKPAIIYMTMENNLNETIERLFSISTGLDNVADYSLDEVLDTFKESLEGDIDLLMEYVPSDGCTTDTIETMITKYEDEGYEIVCFIQDHVKKLRSSDYRKSSELRIELGDIINEMKVIAARHDIPLLTNSHLNRDANRKLEEARAVGKHNIVDLIGRDNIGESLLMLDNTDVCFAIAIEDTYIGVKLLKSRSGTGLGSNIIFLPFESPDSIKLLEDANKSIAAFKYTLNDGGMEQPIVSTGRDNIKVSPYSINNMAELNKSLSINNIYEYNEDEE